MQEVEHPPMDNFPHIPTMLSVAAAVVALVFILNRYLFRPLGGILEERRAKVEGARRELEKSQALQEQRLAEIEARLAETRKEAFAIRDRAQQESRARLDAHVRSAREEMRAEMEAAEDRIKAAVEEETKKLDEMAKALSEQFVERILGRPVSGTKGGP